MKRISNRWGGAVRRLAVPLILAAVAAPSLAAGDPGSLANQAATTDVNASSALVKVLGDYVSVVGGVIAALGAVFGLPLTYQTFRKTRAEIRKIELESRKLETELGTRVDGSMPHGQGDHSVSIRMEGGEGNQVNVMTDPRFAIPLLLLVDALIAYVYYRISSFAIDLIPLPPLFVTPLYLLLFSVIFFPLLRTAKVVKSTLGRAWLPASGRVDEGAPEDVRRIT